ncbi:MAG: hypothetical protein QW782_03140 [Candidatus Bathyarchaeia archaeon]
MHPNLATYYFNDFTPIVRAIGGEYAGDIVVLPYTGPIDVTPYTFESNRGLGVIALARDHFNNTALIVYGLDAQDTYWTAFIATHDWPYIATPDNPNTPRIEGYGDWQALLIKIVYTMGHDWGDGTGIPTAHPTYDKLFIRTVATAREYESFPP